MTDPEITANLTCSKCGARITQLDETDQALCTACDGRIDKPRGLTFGNLWNPSKGPVGELAMSSFSEAASSSAESNEQPPSYANIDHANSGASDADEAGPVGYSRGDTPSDDSEEVASLDLSPQSTGGEPARYDPDRPSWGVLGGVMVWVGSVAALFLLQLMALGLVMLVKQIGSESPIITSPEELQRWTETPSVVMVILVSLFAAHLVTLALCWAVATGFGRRPFRAVIGSSWTASPGSKFAFVFVITVVMYIVIQTLGYLIPQTEETMFDRLLKTSQEVRFGVALIAVFTAPLVEELVYRAILYSGLRKALGVWPSVTIVTLLFAGVHFFQYWGAWAALMGLTILSFTLTVIRARTKSITPCIAIHLLFNFAQGIVIVSQRG